MTKAKMAIRTINRLRRQNRLNRKFPSDLQTSANVKKLIIAGKAMPTDDKQNAPINEINDSKFGIAMAKKTVKLKTKFN